jgi:K+-transporting ATPase KdpF subunit
LLDLHQSLRPPLGAFMDYIIGGVTSLFLFAYLIYALLKPEKF